MAGRTSGAAGKPAKGCPVCGAAAEARWRPFCSRRCADVDLGRWLTGSYSIPGEPTDSRDEDAAPGPRDD
ncbi:DNA gyrase inhibitor YacG [Limibaculum sp. FT325]|uniref:DNA gyrase inhibitor YacG n=1 Tax=Thermohalobaculum sediminis TaxID=2939436 RepID=UPI00209AFFDC|nr:DNA gyrase inhibitor YacG [Limibaculum sediminis]MCL5778899.1 DNA gyrase inhibitor YacG [Limibaculum sediminis]